MTQRQIHMAAAAVGLIMRKYGLARNPFSGPLEARELTSILLCDYEASLDGRGGIFDRDRARRALSGIAIAALAALYDLKLLPGPDPETGGPADA